MTKTQARKRLRSMMRETRRIVLLECDRLLNSGALDPV